MARNGLTITYDTLTPGIEAFAPKMHSAVVAVMEYHADVATAHAKSNAPWTDRTGNARRTLNAQAFSPPDRYVIVVYHQMPYGVWLEVRWSGRYAIILPTIETVGPRVMRTLRRLMARM